MFHKKWHVLFAMLIVGGLVLSACGETTEVEVTRVVQETVVETVKETVIVAGTPEVVEKVVTVEAEKWTGPGFGGELHFAMAAGPPTADSPTTSESRTQLLAIHMNETLVAMSETYKPVPMLAASWEVSDDGTTYTFRLREGVKFHNGEEMTSEDVLASFNRFMEVSPRASSFETVDSVEAPDDYTVVFKLSEPGRVFLLNLASIYADLAIQPKSVIEGKGAGELKVPDEIIGTGPYKLKTYNPDVVVVLERFEDYQPLPGERDGVAGAKIPYFDRIFIHIVPEEATQVAGLESGEYDIIESFTDADFVRFVDNPDITTFNTFPSHANMILFNHDEKYTGDLTFRQAILAALDMEEVALYVSGGNEEGFRLNPYLWPPEGAMYLPNDRVAEAQYNQNDVEKAKQLLEESGYQGEELIWTSSRAWIGHWLIAEAVSDQLDKKLGIKIKIENFDPSGMMAKWEEKTGWNFAVGQYQSYNYQPLVLQSFWTCDSSSTLRGGYCNEEMDAAFHAALTAMTDEEDEAAWREVQRLFWETLPNIKLYDAGGSGMHRAVVKNYSPWYRPRFFGVWKEEE